MVENEWHSVRGGPAVTLTWPHNHASLSKSDLEDKVNSTFHNDASIERVFVRINGHKNNLNLVAEFGFLPTMVAWNQTAAAEDPMDGLCTTSVVMMLSEKLWFYNANDSLAKPFKFAGGCVLPPNQLVIKYVARYYHYDGQSQNTSDEKDRTDGAGNTGTCSNDTGEGNQTLDLELMV